jgi:hypothetical protein
MDQVLGRSEQAALGRAMLLISFPTAPEIQDAHYQIQTVRGIRRRWNRKDLGLDAPARPEGLGDFVRGKVYIRVWQDDPRRRPQLLTEELKRRLEGPKAAAQTVGVGDSGATVPTEPLDLDWEELPFGRLSPEEREAWSEGILDLLFDPVKVPGSSERAKRIAEVGIQKLEDGTEVEVMSPLSVLEYLYFNSPSFRNLVRERPGQVEGALAKLEAHRQGWLEAWNTFRAQYFVLDAVYSLLGPEVAAQYETDLFLRDLSRVLNDAFRVLQFERTTEAWDRNLGYRVALESGDIPEEFMLSPMNYQPMLELKDILKKGSSIGYDLPPALDPVYAKLTRIFFDYAPELRQARESLVEVVERIYREGLGELALALSEAGVVLRGDEASRQAVEEAARRIYRTIAEACRLKGEPLA